MKKRVLFFGFLMLAGCVCALAQNKTMGVGVATPNPNAVLHVESPTGNQGFILPRLTTAQRTATGFVSVLGPADNGLLVYDTDLSTVFTWDGSAWSGPQLTLPYADTVTSAPDGSNLLRLVYAGSDPGNVGVAHFENMNPNSGFSAIFGRTNSATNGVADFVVNNPENNNDGISVTTNGVGSAGRFTVNNTGGLTPAIWAQTNSNQPLSAAVYGLNTGTGDAAGVFRINNAASTFSAAFAETNGSGPAVYASQLGNGPGIYVVKNGGGSANVAAVFSRHLGASGYAGIFQNENAANPRSALFAESVGTGESIWAQKSMPTSTGIAIFGDHLGSSGQAGLFTIDNNANPSSALEAKTNGTGSALSLENSNNGNALSIVSGSVKVSTYEVTTGTITTRAAAYRITGGGSTFTFGFTPADGEMFIVYNDTGGSIDVEGLSVGLDAGRIIINFNGTFRGL